MKERIAYLVRQYRAGIITGSEKKELFDLIQSDSEGRLIPDAILLDMQSIEPSVIDEERWKPVIERILDADKSGRVVVMKRRSWIKWIAAASIIIIIAAAVVGLLTNNHKDTQQTAQQTHDVPAPANTRAVITLANGQKVYLDSVSNGTIAKEINVSVVKNSSGEIVYNREDTKTQGEMAYNTLFNPRGSKVISLTLSDGTKVWLNSESSLKYPIAFNGNTREVEITGEAYFEVAHIAPGFNPGIKSSQNKQGFSPMPFIVKKGDVSVTVLGTHFNVNAYDDEDALKVTLLEGSVKVSAKLSDLSFSAVKIKPGQQAVASNPANPSIRSIQVQNNIDVDAVMAWKNGYFSFSDADIPTIMRQISRWYDVTVSYEGKIPTRTLDGKIPRGINMSDALAALQYSGIKFKIEDRKIIVTP